MGSTARHLLVFVVAATVAGSSGRAAAQARWPYWGGDLHNTHNAVGETAITSATVGQLKPKWTFSTLGDVYAIPTVSEGAVYLIDAGLPLLPGWPGSWLRALDAQSGKQLWAHALTDYTGSLVRNIARTSPAVANDTIVIGDSRNEALSLFDIGSSGTSVYAINRNTGALKWKTMVDPHPLSVVTQSPVVYDDVVYVGVSSLEEAAARLLYPCCSFRGSMVALDLKSGRILWKTYLLPENGGASTGYAGAAVWGSSPSIDEKRHVVYIATGNAYRLPGPLADCLATHVGDPKAQQEQCYTPLDAPDDYAFSVLALDLTTGAIRWAQKLQNYGAWTLACDPQLAPWLPANSRNCQSVDGLDFDFGQAPMLYTTAAGRDLVAVGQKSGTFWAFDPDAGGKVVWATPVGPGGNLGGMEFGAATDGKRIYTSLTNFQHTKFTLTAGPQAGTTVNGGIWAALDAATGELLWQLPDPSSFRPMTGLLAQPYWGIFLGPGYFGVDMGPVTLVNGLLFAGSMDPEGHVYAIDGATGAIKWSFATGGSVMSAPAVVDGTLYWGTGYDRGFNNTKFFAFGLPR